MAINLAELIPSVFTGPNGERLTPEQIARRKEVAQSLLSKATDTSPNAGGWTSVLAKGVMGLSHGMNEYRADQATKANAESEASAISSMYEPYTANTEAVANSLVGGSVDPAVSVVNPEPNITASINMDGNQVYNEFMNTVKTGVNNPYALAAIAATGKRESSFSPKNVNRTWSDPSESGQAGTAGGIMSWRGPRYQALASTGDLSPAGQAKFFLNEDPKLIERLNNAQSVEEAQSIMNNAWRFAGHDRQGGEAAKRLNLARSYLPSFQGSTQVASSSPQAAIDAIATPSGSVNPSAQVIEPQFDMGRFGDPINLAEMPPSAQALPVNLAAQQSAMQPSPEVASALVGQEPTIPQPRQEIAASLVGQPVEVASNQFVPPSLPEIPAPPPLNPAVMQVLRDPYASDRSKQVAQGIMNQHIQQQDAYKKAVAERQMQQRDIDMRVSLAQQRGLDPSVAYDENMWKAAIDADFRAQTTNIQDYEYAKQGGYQGSFTDFVRDNKRAGASQTNVDTGTIPQGYQAVRDEAGRLVRYEPVPGGPADTRGADEAKESNRKTASSVITNAAQRAREALNADGLPATGLVGKALSINPVTNAAEVRRQVDVLKSNATVENLNAMRAASPTGGALGSVTEKEGAMLAAKSGTLDPDSPNFLRDLEDYERTMLRIVHGYEEGDKLFNELYGAASTAPEGKTTATGVKWSVE